MRNILFQQDKMAVLLDSRVALICNSFSGQQLQRIQLGVLSEISAPAAAFTPDGRFLMLGLTTGQILVFDSESGERIAKYEGHSQQCQSILFSPSHVFFVTCSDSLIFWGPQTHLAS